MSQKQNLLDMCKSITTLYNSGVVYHQKRFGALSKRVQTVVDLINTDSGEIRDISLLQAMDLLNTTLEDIRDFMTAFSVKNAKLANHIIMYGSDEEKFVKWNERLQHCVDGIGQSSRIDGVFDQKVDLQNFEQDLAALRADLGRIVLLLMADRDSLDVARLRHSLELLLGHQSDTRSTYQTKTSPQETLEINPKRIKYESIIGRGGSVNSNN